MATIRWCPTPVISHLTSSFESPNPSQVHAWCHSSTLGSCPPPSLAHHGDQRCPFSSRSCCSQTCKLSVSSRFWCSSCCMASSSSPIWLSLSSLAKWLLEIHGLICKSLPIGSMYAIYGNIYHQYTPNVSIYTIHGSYWLWKNERCAIKHW